MPKVCNLCISPVWLCHHKIVMMLQNSIYPFELEIKLLFYVLFCRDVIYTLYLSQKRFTHFIGCEKRFKNFVRKVFASWVLPSGKFRLFGPLGVSLIGNCRRDRCPINQTKDYWWLCLHALSKIFADIGLSTLILINGLITSFALELWMKALPPAWSHWSHGWFATQ